MSSTTRGLRPFAPTRFGRYTLVHLIANGGMGAVYLGKMGGVEGFEKLVVIKKILPQFASDELFVERFVNEAKLLVKLHHGSVAQVFEMGAEGDEYYIALEFVDGKDLRKLISRCRERTQEIPAGLACFSMVRVLDALAYAHRKKDDDERELNLIHRDISPQNVLISYEGEVKVIDFGLAKSAVSASKTNPSMIVGKFFYMAPEQATYVPLDRRSDLYAVGLCLWELLVGKHPFDDVPPNEIMERIARPEIPDPRTFRPALPAEVAEVVMKALAVDRDERYATAEEMRGRLTAALYELDPNAGPESLAAFMRSQFSGEYDSERKAMAALSRIRVDESGASNGAGHASLDDVAPPAASGNALKDLTAAAPSGVPFQVGAPATPADRTSSGERRGRPALAKALALPRAGPATGGALSPAPHSAAARNDDRKAKLVLAGLAGAVVLFGGVATLLALRSGGPSQIAAPGPAPAAVPLRAGVAAEPLVSNPEVTRTPPPAVPPAMEDLVVEPSLPKSPPRSSAPPRQPVAQGPTQKRPPDPPVVPAAFPAERSVSEPEPAQKRLLIQRFGALDHELSDLVKSSSCEQIGWTCTEMHKQVKAKFQEAMAGPPDGYGDLEQLLDKFGKMIAKRRRDMGLAVKP
jgi:serine/threonine-protein kinase